MSVNVPFEPGSMMAVIAPSLKKKKPVICSIDVGSGYVKMSKSTDTNIKLHSFPSIPAKKSDQSLAVEEVGNRECETVYVNGCAYEIGDDAELSQTRGGIREFDEEYSMSDGYLALFYGALLKLKETDIDIMVVGLPITHSKDQTKVDSLKTRLEGEHRINGDIVVNIKKVRVVGQPMGGLYDYLNRSGKLQKLGTNRYLIVDPGQYTWDWVYAQGAKPIHHLCGSHTISMRQIIQEIENNIGKHLNAHFSGSTYVERALKEGSIMLKGNRHPINKFIDENVTEVVSNAINQMRGHLDEIEKIEKIVLCGGGSVLLKPYIEKAFEGYEVISNDEPFYNNVRGYQVIGTIDWFKNNASL